MLVCQVWDKLIKNFILSSLILTSVAVHHIHSTSYTTLISYLTNFFTSIAVHYIYSTLFYLYNKTVIQFDFSLLHLTMLLCSIRHNKKGTAEIELDWLNLTTSAFIYYCYTLINQLFYFDSRASYRFHFVLSIWWAT